MKNVISLFLALILAFSLCACGQQEISVAPNETKTPTGEVLLTDMIGREVSIVPGGYDRVVCIGAGALRMYSYIGDVGLLCGVEDIDNTALSERPMMFDSVARPYVLAYGDVFSQLPSCGVGGPMAQTAEAEKILSCDPDIVISEYEDAPEKVWQSNMFGKSLYDLVSDGMRSKLDHMPDESREKLGETLERIINEGAGGLLCILL